jgi:hypothetical protein
MARLVIPTGILRIPVFSSPVALFSQESQFLFLRNFLGHPQESCLHQAYGTRPTYIEFLRPPPKPHSSKKFELRKKNPKDPVWNAILGP